MKLILLSDIHNAQWNLKKLPDGDVLIVAGDLTCWGNMAEIASVDNWLGTLPFKHKIVIGGNHDKGLESDYGLVHNATFLHNNGVTIDGIRFYGTGYNNTYGSNWAFNDPGDISLIPDSGVDVLITHCPPYGIMDYWAGKHGGDGRLLDKVLTLKPRIHCFGHVHEEYGAYGKDGIKFFNCAIQDEHGVMIKNGVQIREPHVVEINSPDTPQT